MSFDHKAIQETIHAWPDAPVPDATDSDSLNERIRQILHAAQRRLDLGPWKGDFIPLVRHLLLRESYAASRPINLLVPTIDGWPGSPEWVANGFSTLPGQSGFLLLSALPWNPTWLDPVEDGIFADAFRNHFVRPDGRVPADPFIADATGYSSYSCPGQREAVRGAFLMRQGETLIVNLPTGSGKSLVGQAPTLVHSQDGNLTLFVVPTVALAIDQARQMMEYFREGGRTKVTWPLAWHGSLSSEHRADVRRRLLDGTQRILFTSPEALTTSLLRTVFDVARAGMLRYLVIDEAHLVTQWGDDFRPAFQMLAGIRNGLLRQSACGFKTLLLSATFTSETVKTLSHLFGPPEKVQLVSAVHLRPEPQYWFHHAESVEEKQLRVLEALQHAPRPFILYVTTRKEAREWFNRLKNSSGLNRVALFDGGTADHDRERIIKDWVHNALDGVVATSAFGVGIDKADVRTIVHATIPETLDRFYQEVGRGGRDGKPSVSLLVYEDGDWALPQRLGTPAIISNELGINRWKALYASQTSERPDLIRINLDAVPKHGRSGSEYNVDWNMRTLLLMLRAGMINIDMESNDEFFNDAETTSFSSPLAAMATVRISIINSGHLLDDVWEAAVGPTRLGTYEAGAKNLRLMRALLQGTTEVASTLAELYQISLPNWKVDVTRACGGCPADRSMPAALRSYHVPIGSPVHSVPEASFASWKAVFPWLEPSWVLIFYGEKVSPSAANKAIIKFVGWLVRECGVREVAGERTSSLVNSRDWKLLYRKASDGVLVHRDLDQLDEEPYTPLSRVTILEGASAGRKLQQVMLLQRPFHVVLLPEDTPDPENELRLLSGVTTNSAKLDQILALLNQ
jgi:ATP-dependent DNA helicase RecQ